VTLLFKGLEVLDDSLRSPLRGSLIGVLHASRWSSFRRD